MSNFLNKGLIFLLAGIFLGDQISAQDLEPREIEYEVYKIFPPISISKQNLIVADSLVDLNKNFNSSWIKEFINVEISTSHNGELRKSVSKNDVLTKEQRENINSADPLSKIVVKVDYIPQNNLKINDPKVIHFSVSVNPDRDAYYEGGDEKLKDYFKKNVVDKLPDDVFNRYQLAAVKFTIDNVGHVSDVHVFWSSEDNKVDQLMVESVCNMTGWTPAQYSNGLKVKQEYAFMLGDMESCVINMLNIREDCPE